MRSCASSLQRLELVWLWWWFCVYLRTSVTLAVVVSVPENVTYRVGGLAITGAEAFIESFEPTFSAYLNRTVGKVFPGVGFVAVPLAFEDVWPAVSSVAVDFLFLNPSSASCMESEFGVGTILSLRNLRQGMELNEFGGVVITEANRTDITEIVHLKDKVVEGVSISGLGAFQLQWGLIQDAGLNLMADPSEVRLAYNQKKIVRDIIDGNADVGFVRTDMVERMDAAGASVMFDRVCFNPLPTAEYQSIQGILFAVDSEAQLGKTPYGEANLSDVSFAFVREDTAASGFPYPVSTDLVPEWPLQALSHVPADLSKEVVLALMQLNQTHEAAIAGGYSTWDAPLSYSHLSALQAQLGVLNFHEQRCIQSEDVYGAVVCPEGFFRVSRDVFGSKCTDLGKVCPDGYTCLCRPCELLPEMEFSFSLIIEGQPVGTEACEQKTTCATGISAFSNLTILVVDNWLPARETLGLNHASTLEVHVIAVNNATACFAAGHGQFPCSESVINGGLGAPPLNDTQDWESEVSVSASVRDAGSTLLRVIVDGENIEASPTVLGVEAPSCEDLVYDVHVGSCSNNGSRWVSFHFADVAIQDLCGRSVDLPDSDYNLECDYAPWGSAVGVGIVFSSAIVTTAAVALTIWTVVHRTAKPIVAAQWIFCVVFSSSIAVVSLEAVLVAGPPTDFTCIAKPIMFNLGTGAAISSICVKMWRVLMIWEGGMKRVKIKNAALFRYLAALLSVDVAVLLAMCLFRFPQATVSSTKEQVSGVVIDLENATCDVGQHIFTRMLTVYHGLVACATCGMSFKARKAGPQYMETQAVVTITVIIGLLGVVSLSSTCDKACKVLLSSVGTTASATIALICIYGPKVMWVHFRRAPVYPHSDSPSPKSPFSVSSTRQYPSTTGHSQGSKKTGSTRNSRKYLQSPTRVDIAPPPCNPPSCIEDEKREAT